MSKCLDLFFIGIQEETNEEKIESIKNLKKLCKTAKVDNDTVGDVIKQYEVFKERVKKVVQCEEYNEVVKRFERFLFQIHSSSQDCS